MNVLTGDMQVGDLDFKINDDPDIAWNAVIRGPYKILQFCKRVSPAAVLAMGATLFKPSVTF
jgi:hypothetical protein